MTNEIFIIGNPQNQELKPKEVDLLKDNNIILPTNHFTYTQLYLANKSRILTSYSATKAKKRINHCIMYSSEIHGTKYGLLQKLIMSTSAECFAVIIPLHESTLRLHNNQIAIMEFHVHYIPCLPPRLVTYV